MKWFSNLFRSKVKDSPTSETKSANILEGYKRFEEGLKYYKQKDHTNAVHYFDKAIEMGFYNESYIFRGSSLHALEYYHDAIDDFDKAISISPQDCNIYFDRSLSKSAIEDYKGAVEDLKAALNLSKLKSEINIRHNRKASEMGFSCRFRTNLTPLFRFILTPLFRGM